MHFLSGHVLPHRAPLSRSRIHALFGARGALARSFREPDEYPRPSTTNLGDPFDPTRQKEGPVSHTLTICLLRIGLHGLLTGIHHGFTMRVAIVPSMADLRCLSSRSVHQWDRRQSASRGSRTESRDGATSKAPRKVLLRRYEGQTEQGVLFPRHESSRC
jgi:hypothetical protein